MLRAFYFRLVVTCDGRFMMLPTFVTLLKFESPVSRGFGVEETDVSAFDAIESTESKLAEIDGDHVYVPPMPPKALVPTPYVGAKL
jgi:hypothetical protein